MRLSFTWSELTLAQATKTKTYLEHNSNLTDADEITVENLEFVVVSKFNLFTQGFFFFSQVKSCRTCRSPGSNCLKIGEKCLYVILQYVPNGKFKLMNAPRLIL